MSHKSTFTATPVFIVETFITVFILSLHLVHGVVSFFNHTTENFVPTVNILISFADHFLYLTYF